MPRPFYWPGIPASKKYKKYKKEIQKSIKQKKNFGIRNWVLIRLNMSCYLPPSNISFYLHLYVLDKYKMFCWCKSVVMGTDETPPRPPLTLSLLPATSVRLDRNYQHIGHTQLSLTIFWTRYHSTSYSSSDSSSGDSYSSSSKVLKTNEAST